LTEVYPCGLKGGEKLRLRRPLPVVDATGGMTKSHPAGEEWTVIGGDTHVGDVVWLREPDGSRHTWDNETIFDWFEVVKHRAI
jgi:hypothetical protein